MNDNLIQSITAYASALEQQLAALEARVVKMEEAHEAMKRENEEANALIASFQAEIDVLKTTSVASSVESAEPEIEIELLMDDEEEIEELVEESADGSVVLEVVEEAEEQGLAESSAFPEEDPEMEVVEETAIVAEEEPQPEFVAEPEKKAEPSPRPMPQQTSLFGSAVEDIRQAISLGDRFLFQRELFAGNGELMQKTLDEINSLNSLSEAMDYVLDNFEWDKESTAVQLFENVLKRRFS